MQASVDGQNAAYTGWARREEFAMADGLGKNSARNHLWGTVEKVVLGTVTAKVSVRVVRI